MKCPMCGTEIPQESRLIGPWTIFQSNIHGAEEGGNITVCGSCYMLVNIADTLRKIEEKLNGND